MKQNSVVLGCLLVIYMVLIAISDSSLEGDEFRYLRYAKNMVEGYYTNSINPDLSNGPGYPLILLPFVALNIPLWIAKLLNGIFVFIGILYLYKTLKFFVKPKYALVFAVIVGVYPPLLRYMTVLYSEAFSFMLGCGFIYYFCFLYQQKKHRWKSCILASFFLGSLILTKVIFFHVVILSAVLICILLLTKNRSAARWPVLVLFGGTIVAMPFIIYAYSVTGKLFYLSTRSGEILYHRSTPFENELGNWFTSNSILDQETANENSGEVYHDLSKLRLNHREFYLQLESLSNMERDSAFKARAFENMKAHPLKYLKNTVANTARFLFNYPFSYRSQNMDAYGYIIPNMFIVVFFILIVYPALLHRKKIPFEIWALLTFGLIYGCGMLIAAGTSRYFIMMVPFLVVFLGYCYTNILKIAIEGNEN